MQNEAFWKMLTQMVEESDIVIDRPKHTCHPVMTHIIYPVDYGYLNHTSSSDAEGIDIWVGSEPEKAVQGILCTVDSWKRDSEIKILYGCTEAEIQTIYAFTNARNGMKGILIRGE